MIDLLPTVLASLPFHSWDPVAFEIGPVAIRWYSLAYLVGLIAGWQYVHWLNQTPPHAMSEGEADDLLLWMTLGVILGGRLGYVIFYNPMQYLANPLQILTVWQGGMSFHGGLAGVLLAMWWFGRRRGIPFLALSDLAAAATPIGLFLGRLANFVNGELYGRVSDVPWAMAFPKRDGSFTDPRHPSQLYEAALEGLVLFFVLLWLARFTNARRRPGIVGGVFLGGYGLSRIIVEFFREPDAHIGYLGGVVTMGQLLSVPMVVFGVWLVWRARNVADFEGRARVKEDDTPERDEKSAKAPARKKPAAKRQPGRRKKKKKGA